MADENPQSIYEPQGREHLAEIAAARRLNVEGTGSNGYVSKDDLVKALDADDQGLGVAQRFEALEAERDELKAKVEALEADAGKSGPSTPSEEREIERENDTTWWCPFDDNANAQTLDRCGHCGGRRDGDTVTRA